MPPTLPTTLLLRILHASTSPSALPSIDTLTHLWLALRPVCRAFRTEIESIFLTSYLPNLEIRVAVYSQDVYQTCDPAARLLEVKYDARRPSVPFMEGGCEEEGLERIGLRGEKVGRGGGVEERGMRSGFKEGKVEVRAPPTGPDDIVFTFSHTPLSNTSTAVFTPPLPYSTSLPTAMALASLASRFSSRLMVKKPTHVVSWYGCVNDVFLPGLKVDLVGGWVEVEWRGLVGGFLGEERGVCGVRRGLVGGGKGVRRGLCALGGGRVAKAGAATRSRLNDSVHESPTMELPMAKKRRGNGKGKAKGRDGVRRKFGRDKVDIDLMNQSPSASSAAPVVIDLDAVRTPLSPPSRNIDFDFDFDRNLDVDLNLDLLPEADWEHIPPPPQRLDGRIPPSSTSFSSSFFPFKSNDFGFDFSSPPPPPLPFSLSPSLPSSLATSPPPPFSNTPLQPPSPSPTLYSQYPSHYPLPTPPPPQIPTNTLNWDIDPARLEARRRRVAYLFRKFCCNGEKNVGENVGREMGEEFRWEMERDMGFRGWIMGEWCAVERVQSLRMEVGG